MLGTPSPSANVWVQAGRSGVTPKRAPSLTLNVRAVEQADPFGQRICDQIDHGAGDPPQQAESVRRPVELAPSDSA